MNSIKPISFKALLILALILLSGCQEKEIAVDSVKLDKTLADMVIGDNLTLKATVLPANATNPYVYWSSSSPTVASVSVAGYVTALSEGTATITAQAESKQATCVITVSKPYIKVTSIKVDKGALQLAVSDDAKIRERLLTATVSPNDATDPTVSWSSSNNSVATVENGLIKAVAPGDAVITAKAGDASTTCPVKILDPKDGIIYFSTDGRAVTPYNLSGIESNNCVDGVGQIKVSGTPVIGLECFKECTTLEIIMIPEGVTDIGAYAFYECSSLNRVYLPKNVNSIGSYAFFRCNLARVTMQTGLTKIGSYSFARNRAGITLSLPEGVIDIDEGAFTLSLVDSISLPSTLKSIGAEAFKSTSLKRLSIPDGVTFIGMSAFSSCEELEEVKMSEGILNISSFCFQNCYKLKSINLPKNLGAIGMFAFWYTGITLITIPSKVADIDNGAFMDCTSLKTIEVKAIKPPILHSSNPFSGSTCPIYVPKESLDAYKSQWYNIADRIIPAEY